MMRTGKISHARCVSQLLRSGTGPWTIGWEVLPLLFCLEGSWGSGGGGVVHTQRGEACAAVGNAM